MKFAALALTLLLAVGSYGDEWPGDSIKKALPDVQEVADRIVNALLDTEYKDQVPEIKQRVAVVLGSIGGFLDSDELKGLYVSAKSHSEQITQRWQNSLVRSTIIDRVEEYKTIFSNFFESHREAFEGLRTELLAAISKNHEKTTTVLSDAATTVSQDIRGYVESLRAMVQPYITEYKDHFQTALEEARGSNLRETIAPKVIDIRTKMSEIYFDILTEMNKN